MGRCNNRRTQQAAEAMRNTPARARFSSGPPRKKRGGRGGGRDRNASADDSKQGRGGRTGRGGNAATRQRVVEKIAKRSETTTTSTSTTRRTTNPLSGVDLSKLEKLTLSEESIELITNLLKDLKVVKRETEDSESEEDSVRDSREDFTDVTEEEQEDQHRSTTEGYNRSTGYEENEDDGEEEYAGSGPSHLVVQADGDTEWQGETTTGSSVDVVDEKLRQDPVFFHLTRKLSFRESDAARACRAVENWSAVNKNTTDDSKTTSKLVNVMDWLCLHMSEQDLTAGFKTNQIEVEASKAAANGLLLAGTGRTKAIPHPSISIAKKLTEDTEFFRSARLEERVVGFLRLGFHHGEIVQALEKTDYEGKKSMPAYEDTEGLMALLAALEVEVLEETNTDRAVPDEVADEEEMRMEREMEQEALVAIYEDQFHTLDASIGDGIAVHRISREVEDTPGVTDIRVFLRKGYPANEVPLFLVTNSSLPWPFLRRLNSEVISCVHETGVGGPLLFEIFSFVFESLAEMLVNFQKEQVAKQFALDQAKLRQEAGHIVEVDTWEDVHMGRRQKARLKGAARAFDNDEKARKDEEERKLRQAERQEQIKKEDRNLRQNMAARAIKQRELEQQQEGIRQAGRLAMGACLSRGESVEEARKAKRRGEAAYRQEHGISHTEEGEQSEHSDSLSEDGDYIGKEDAIDGNDTPDRPDTTSRKSQQTATTASFMEKLRSMYDNAAKAKTGLSAPKETSGTLRDEDNNSAGLPEPIAPSTEEADDMMEDIIAMQAEQPWLIADEARVPCKATKQTPKSIEDISEAVHVPANQEAINRELKESFQKKNRAELGRTLPKSKNKKHSKILEQRMRLPAFSMREDIVSAISANQVSLVVGSTGCGKTTQVPQLVLGDMIENNRGSEANIIVTQPRRISAMGVAERISAELGEHVGDTCGYSIKLEKKCSRKTRILLCTTGILLRRLQVDPDLAAVSHVFIDEVHERDMLTDFLLIVLKQLAQRRKSLKLVLMSATVNAEIFANYFNGCAQIEIPGRTFPVSENRLEDVLKLTGHEIQEGSDYAVKGTAVDNTGRLSKSALRKMYYPRGYDSKVIHSLSIVDESVINYELLADLLEHITDNEDEGAILVFLPGMMEITKCIDEMRRKEIFQGDQAIIYPLHSSLSTSEQTKVFDVPPKGVRKIVVSTNIAETSITIEDVVYVVDSGRVKENRRDEVKETPALVECWVSRSSAKQRRGRSGRVRAGVAYHMYSSHTHDNNMREYTIPEILRVGVEDLTLQILVLDLGEPHKFLGLGIDPPSPLAMRNALTLLEELGAVECKWNSEDPSIELCSQLDVSIELTALGFHLATLPVEPRIGKIMIYGAILGCVEAALTIAASMSSKNFFASSFDNRQAADEARQALAMDNSDHLTVVAVFNEWQEVRAKRGNNKAQKFMVENFINRSALFQMEQLRRQYAKLLGEIGFLPQNYKPSNTFLMRKEDASLFKAVLCAGLYPNIIVAPRALAEDGLKQPANEVAFQSRRKGDVFLHPSTLMASAKKLDSRYLCFHEIVKTRKLYVRDATMVTPYSLLLFGGALEIYHNQQAITVDKWLRFRIDRKPATLVKHLRFQMETMLLEKIVSPVGDTESSQHAAALISAVRALLQSEKNDLDPDLFRTDGAEIVRPYLGSEHERGQPPVRGRGRGKGRGRGRGGRGRGNGGGRGRY